MYIILIYLGLDNYGMKFCHNSAKLFNCKGDAFFSMSKRIQDHDFSVETFKT